MPENTFSYQSKTAGWTEDENYSVEKYFINYNPNNIDDMGVRMADINGDGLLDLVRSHYYLDNSYYNLSLNDGDGTWTDISSCSFPEYFSSNDTDKGVRLTDVNGDGMADFLISKLDNGGATQEVYINNGDFSDCSFWEEDESYTIPVYFVRTENPVQDYGVRIADVNGDGLPDILRSHYYSDTSYKAVYINDGDGTGWTFDDSYTIPEYFLSGTADQGVRLEDVNGDGLVDILKSYDNGGDVKAVYINKGDGTGWEEDPNYSIPIVFSGTNPV
ncbi:MAG: VCBS repeat-containing protein [Candidatus Falkowbacteria bacterium]